MSKRINVNPDHYKVAGRERPGDDVVASENKQKFGNVQHELASRSEQRNRSLEAMRGAKAPQPRDASPGRSAQVRGRKKGAPPSRTVVDDDDGGGAPRRRFAAPEGVRRIASAGAAKLAALPATKLVARKATKTAKKTRRAAVTAGATAAAAAKKAAARAKKAVTPRPKQALPKKRAAAGRRGAPRAPISRGPAQRPARKK